MTDNQGLDNKVQNEGSKPDELKKRLAGRDQEQMIQNKFKENDERKKQGDSDSSTIEEVTSDSIFSP